MTKNPMVLPLFCALFLMTACSSDKPDPAPPPKQIGTMIQPGKPELLTKIFVYDLNGKALSGASILIGNAPNQPFKNNLLTTDSSGAFTPPAEWIDAQPVTITADGYVRTTFMSQLPVQKSYEVRPRTSQVKPELNGTTTGFGELKKDGFVDVGIVIPAFTRIDLISFQASSLLSPETDEISVVGKKLTLPSNITLPEQSETIFPVTVKLNKPTYRMFFDRPASYKIISAHVKFPLKKVISEVQSGKSGIDLVNDFTFLEAGVSNTLIATEKQSLDLTVNKFQFTSNTTAKAPSLGQNQSIMAVAVVKDGEDLFPTDIKTLTSGESKQLSFQANASGFVLGILKDNGPASTHNLTGASADFMSAQLRSSSDATAFEFLSLLSAPKYSNGILSLNQPTQLPNLKSVATLATLSAVEVKTLGKGSYEIKSPEWDVYSAGWVSEIRLPTSLLNIKAPQLRWETTYMAEPDSTAAEALGPKLMNSVTHLTRSAVDL